MKKTYPEAFLSFPVKPDGEIEAPAGCHQCSTLVQDGHEACSSAPTEILEAASSGKCFRALLDGAWKWLLI